MPAESNTDQEYFQANAVVLRSFRSQSSLATTSSPADYNGHGAADARSLSRSRKSGQYDKWNFCLKAAMIAANRRDHEQTTAPEPHTGLQGEGGACRRQG